MNLNESPSIASVFTEPAIYEEQVTVPLSTALTHIHFVTASECLLLIFSATRNSVMPIVSYTSHYHAILMTPTNMRENVLFTVLHEQAGHS
jgi:hypothetical protein